uniref:Coiled-coil domain-containing protein 39 n=1 Tax=Myripristis murdjan TaxID=586833 RepID=A0A667YYS9_9TELE
MLSQVLAELGWDEGLAVPEANAENRALQAEVSTEKRNMQLENKLEGFKDQINLECEQLKTVKQELSHTQALLKAKERETDLERHFKALAERETGRLQQEMGNLENELRLLREKKNAQENTIFKATQKLEELRVRQNWDQQTLDAWLEESARKDEETMAIIKYAQQDEHRIKVLTVAIEKKTLEANQKRKALDREMTETISAQIALDKTAENLRQAHLERQELIHQWSNTIEHLRKRDAEMQQCALLDSIKGNLERTAADVETVRSHISSMKKDTQDKTDKLQEARLHNAGLEEKLKAVTQTALSVEERAAQMDQLLKDEEQAVKELDVQLQRHREALAHQKQDLQTLWTKERDALSQISRSKATITSLESHLGKLDQYSLKQQEIMYNQELQIQQLKRKLARLQGEVNTEEKQMLEEKVTELTSALSEKRKDAKIFTTQLKDLEVSLSSHLQKRDLTTKIEELNLINDVSEKELKRLRLKKQDTMVDDSILKLEIERLRDLLYNKADSMLSMEKRKLELQTAMRKREEEIKVYREMLSKKVKINDQERQALSLKLHERLSKIDIMRKRYEVLTISMAAPEGEEEKSQAYYITKAAQEKEELKRKGDSLDATIRKMEVENRALENTIQLVNNNNSAFRKSLKKVDETSPEYQEKLKLEEQQKAAEEKLMFKKRQVRKLQEDIQDMNNTLGCLLQDKNARNEKTEQTQSHVIHLNKVVASQKEKLDRATKQCAKLTKEIRSANQTKTETFEERDIELREMRELYRTVYRMLHEATEEKPDLREALEKYLLQANLPLLSPASTPASRLSSKTNSARSSASARSDFHMLTPAHRSDKMPLLGVIVTTSTLFSSCNPTKTDLMRANPLAV